MTAANVTNLEKMQGFFATAVQHRAPVTESADPAHIKAFVAGNTRLSPAAQLEIYREQFWLRHVSALVEDFATVHHLLGHDAFTALCEEYLAAYPNADFSLRDLGAKLVSFLWEHPAHRLDPLILDCARVEWAFVEAFDAPDAPPLDPTTLVNLPEDAWPSMRLTLHPSVQRLALAFPAHELRAQVKAGEDPPRPDASLTYLVVYRGPEMLQYIAIEPLAFGLLGRLASGETLGEACDAMATTEELTATLEEKIGGWFQAWASYGWISQVRSS